MSKAPTSTNRTGRKIGQKVKKTKLKASSRRWLERHINDPYVQRAKLEGYRARAAFKLLEINDKHQILKGATRIIDLGAALGGLQRAPHFTQRAQHLCTVETLTFAVFAESHRLSSSPLMNVAGMLLRGHRRRRGSATKCHTQMRSGACHLIRARSSRRTAIVNAARPTAANTTACPAAAQVTRPVVSARSSSTP